MLGSRGLSEDSGLTIEAAVLRGIVIKNESNKWKGSASSKERDEDGKLPQHISLSNRYHTCEGLNDQGLCFRPLQALNHVTQSGKFTCWPGETS